MAKMDATTQAEEPFALEKNGEAEVPEPAKAEAMETVEESFADGQVENLNASEAKPSFLSRRMRNALRMQELEHMEAGNSAIESDQGADQLPEDRSGDEAARRSDLVKPARIDRSTLRPLAENPAQPLRGQRRVEVEEEIEQWESDSKPIPEASGRRSVKAPAKEAEQERREIPKRPLLSAMKRKRAEAKRVADDDWPEDSLWNDGDDGYDDEYDGEDGGGDDDDDDVYVSGQIRMLSVGLVLVVLLGMVGFLFLSGTGKRFRASMGWAAPASAYWDLGERRFNDNQFKAAADAYHSALRLDRENYNGALKLGQASELAGETEQAIKAYQLCIQLNPKGADAYAKLVKLLEKSGMSAEANAIREQAHKAGAVGEGDS